MYRYSLQYAQQTWLATLHFSMNFVLGSQRQKTDRETLISKGRGEDLTDGHSPANTQTHWRLNDHKTVSTYRPSSTVLENRLLLQRVNHFSYLFNTILRFATPQISNSLVTNRSSHNSILFVLQLLTLSYTVNWILVRNWNSGPVTASSSFVYISILVVYTGLYDVKLFQNSFSQCPSK